MDDLGDNYDIFTDEIQFTNSFYKKIVNKLVYESPATPNGPNYESGRKVLAEESLVCGNEIECAFHLSESVAASMRNMMIYREDRLRIAGEKLQKIISILKPTSDLVAKHPISEDSPVAMLMRANKDVLQTLNKYQTDEKIPFYKEYLRFSPLNNVDNFKKILSELPKEWSIVQVSSKYNYKENLVPRKQFRTEISQLLVTPLTGDHLAPHGPLTVTVAAHSHHDDTKPLFAELYSVLEDNYNTINNAQNLDTKELIQGYWKKREAIDLRMKNVITAMDSNWLGGWGCLLTGRLVDEALRDKLVKKVDATLLKWGLNHLTSKQKVLVYKLMGSSVQLPPSRTRSCAESILTRYGDVEGLRNVLRRPCRKCTKDFRFLSDLCSNCQNVCFKKYHRVSVEDAVGVLCQLARDIKQDAELAALSTAKRYPLILILDELLDTFPWETLPILSNHPVSRVDNIHVLYYLYKTHEPNIQNGHYIMKGSMGRYVINPDKDLNRMEKRMSSFVQYWCDGWRGHVGERPPPQDVLHYLQNAHIFLYCGHGDGCQYAAGAGAGGAGVEGAGCARAVCVLAGCGSVRLHAAPARQPPKSAHRRLQVAGCPSIVGMLWEVTDLEVDKVVTTLLSLCVPSRARLPWPLVGKANWSQGQLDVSSKKATKTSGECEREVLRAVSRGRASTGYLLIASSVVVRGLPVRITDD